MSLQHNCLHASRRRLEGSVGRRPALQVSEETVALLYARGSFVYPPSSPRIWRTSVNQSVTATALVVSG
jgi:hypothetical protein